MNRERTAELEAEYLENHPPGTVEPYVFDNEGLILLESESGSLPFPVLTEYSLAESWEPAGDIWFVDSSGVGQSDEPALTGDQFRRQLLAYVHEHPGHGFGLTGVGQFQVYVTAYRRV